MAASSTPNFTLGVPIGGLPVRAPSWPSMRPPASSPDTPGDAADRLCDMQRAFRATGGLVSGDRLADMLRSRVDQPISLLARWIVDGRVISFEARGATWLPLFQFDPDGVDVTDGVRRVLGELRGVFDNWELVQWFATPNTWLDGASPVDVIADDPQAVVQAARTDRFVAAG